MNAILRQVVIALENNALLRYFAEVSIGACLLVAVELVLVAAKRRQSAAVRHGLWAAALVALLVLPIAKLILPTQLTLGLWDSHTTDVFAAVGAPQQAATEWGQEAAETDLEAASDPTSIEASLENTSPIDRRLGSESTNGLIPQHSDQESVLITFQQAFIGIWFLGLISVLSPYVKSLFAIRRLIARSRTIASGPIRALTSEFAGRLGIRRPVAVCVSSDTLIPIVTGWRQPTIILPASSADWPLDRTRQVILHELAHVKRGDIAWALIARVACAVHWFNPLVWLVAGQLRREREAACDDVVLSMGEPANTFATNLLEIARAGRGITTRLIAGTAMARSTNVRRRIVAILDDGRSRRPLQRVTSWVNLFAALGLALSIAVIGIQNPAGAQTPIGGIAQIPEPAFQPTTDTAESKTDFAARPGRLIWQSDALAFNHRGNVRYLAISPDGRLVATCASAGRDDKVFLLWEVATGKLVKRFDPQDNRRGGGYSVAYSSDGKLILGCWGLGFATVFDVETGQPLFTKKLHNETILHCRFLPDSAHVLTSGSDGKLCVTRIGDQFVVSSWSFNANPTTVDDPFGPAGESRAANSIDVAGDGQRVLMTRYKAGSSEAIIWETESEYPVLRIERPNLGGDGGRAIQSAIFSPDGKQLITAGARVVPRETTPLKVGPQRVQVLEIRRWDAATGELLSEHVANDVHGLGYIQASPDGKTLATDDLGGIHLWRQGEAKPFGFIPRPGNYGSGNLRFLPDGRRLISGTGNTVTIWDLATGEQIGGGYGSITRVNEVAWGAGNRIVISRGRAIELLDAATGQPQRTISFSEPLGPFSWTNDVLGLAFSADGNTLFAAGELEVPPASRGSVVCYWDAATGEKLGEVTYRWSLSREYPNLVISPDARQVVMQAFGLKLYDLGESRMLAEAPGLRPIQGMSFSTDGRSVWTVDGAGQVVRWEPEQNQKHAEYIAEWRTDEERAGPPQSLAVASAVFSSDAKSLVLSYSLTNRTNRAAALVFWDNEQKQIRHLAFDQPVFTLAISPDGQRLAGFEIEKSGSRPPTDAIHIWDVATGQELFTLQPQDARATAMAFSPDGKQLLTGFDRGTIAIWDVQ